MSPLARICLVVCVVALFASPAAQAKAPPKGKYDRTIGGSTLFGTLTIKGGKYTHRGSKGTFKHKGRKLSFKRGTLNKMKGRGTRPRTARRTAPTKSL